MATAIDRRSQDKILALLDELGGSAFRDEDVLYQGSKLVVPEHMNDEQARDFLDMRIRENENFVNFHRVFRYRPFDGAAAMQRVFKRVFGGVVGVSTQSMFGTNPPNMISIDIGPGETEQVPWGNVAVPILPNSTLTTDMYNDEEMGPLFMLHAECPRKYRTQVEGLFRLVEEELATASIYRGKAIDGRDRPEFLELGGVDARKVVYSAETMLQLESNVWSLIVHTAATREAGLPLKRAVLLEGPYGTGKSLALMLTAQKAVENGWTFVLCRPGRDDLGKVLQTARLYMPAVVGFEDVDVVASDAHITEVLDMFDGITAKGTELLAVLTTNHVERIHKGMKRPGRLDAIIPVGSLDTEGICRLIRATVPTQLLGDVDQQQVGEAMAGFLPAFVKEAIDRAVRYAITRTGGAPHKLVTEDFVHAARGLRPQLDLMNESGEGKAPVALDVAMRAALATTIDSTELVRVADGRAQGVRLATNGKR